MEALQDAIGTGTTDQAEMLARLIKRVANLEAAVADSANKRRELHNQLIELRGNVRGPPFSPWPLHALPLPMTASCSIAESTSAYTICHAYLWALNMLTGHY